MVLLFGIFSMEGSQPTTLFCKSMNPDKGQAPVSEKLELFNKFKAEHILPIAEKLYSVYHFHRASYMKSSENDVHLLNSDEILPAFDVGHFKLYPGDPFYFEKQVVWLTVNEIGYMFVLDEKENLSQAEMTLRLIVQQLHDLCRVVLQPNELVSKSEKIHYVLNKFIPNGKLIYMNHRTIRQMERETESVFK